MDSRSILNIFKCNLNKTPHKVGHAIRPILEDRLS